MVDVYAAYIRSRDAFAKPTLTLLGKDTAPVVIAVFSALFSAERLRISADQFHVQVDACLVELRSRDIPVPIGSGRDVARRWVNQNWLWRIPNDDGGEDYTLTSHASEAIDYMTRLAEDRPLVGESRITTILETARRFARDANPDPAERLRRLDADLGRLHAERDRIAAGGAITPATDEQMLDHYLNLRELLRSLPADFRRVGEAMRGINREIVAAFRNETRTAGEILDDYLLTSARLMDESPEGRAFAGAVRLLRDDGLLADLRLDLDAILAHRFTAALTADERWELRRSVAMIQTEMRVVTEQRSLLSKSLATHLTRLDPLRDRELDDTLRRIKTRLSTWMQTAGPRASTSLWMLGDEIAAQPLLRTRMYDPASDRRPQPLAPASTSGADGTTLAELLRQGGPDLTRLSAR